MSLTSGNIGSLVSMVPSNDRITLKLNLTTPAVTVYVVITNLSDIYRQFNFFVDDTALVESLTTGIANANANNWELCNLSQEDEGNMRNIAGVNVHK